MCEPGWPTGRPYLSLFLDQHWENEFENDELGSWAALNGNQQQRENEPGAKQNSVII